MRWGSPFGSKKAKGRLLRLSRMRHRLPACGRSRIRNRQDEYAKRLLASKASFRKGWRLSGFVARRGQLQVISSAAEGRRDASLPAAWHTSFLHGLQDYSTGLST